MELTSISDFEVTMPLEIQNFTVYLNDPHKTLTFKYTVQSYVAGITGFNMSYKDGKSHDVRTLKISLGVTQSGTELDFTVTAQLSDNGGNTLDLAAAWVTIGVIAETSRASGTILLANQSNIESGDNSNGIPVGQNNLVLNQSMLSGFNFSYESDQEIQTVTAQASASFQSQSQEDSITAQAMMKDGDEKSATIAYIDGGLLATLKQNAGVVVAFSKKQQSASSIVVSLSNIPANFKLTGDVMAVLQGFQISYGGTKGNEINTLGAGLLSSGGYVEPIKFGPDQNPVLAVPGLPTIIDKTSVKLPNPRAYMYDLGYQENHSQSDGDSWVDVLIIATIVEEKA